jgi:hypothetical protein
MRQQARPALYFHRIMAWTYKLKRAYPRHVFQWPAQDMPYRDKAPLGTVGALCLASDRTSSHRCLLVGHKEIPRHIGRKF